MIFIALWIAIFAFLALYQLHNPMFRSSLRVLLRERKIWRFAICTVAIILAIFFTYKLHPSPKATVTNRLAVIEDYSALTVQRLDSMGRFKLDSSCSLAHPKPELVYVMPIILNTYVEIVEKPTLPVIVRLDDTLQVEFRGYKQFKNRGIRITRQLQKKLGLRYGIDISSEGKTHTLQVTYKGPSWSIEQLLALPVMEASQKYGLDPALLMSLIKNVSNFDFDFRGPRDSHGLLALHDNAEGYGKNTEGIAQIFEGARRLAKQLSVLSKENAIATFYPEQGMDYDDANWKMTPLVKSWVAQVLADVELYHENGLVQLD